MRPGLSTTAIAGWLFADLLLAFSIVMLGTQAPPVPAKQPHVPVKRALERHYVQVDLTIDPAAARRGDASAVRALRRAVRAEPRLRGRKAGIVLTFAAQYSGGEGLAHAVNALLKRADGRLFASVATRDFQLIGASGGALRLNIYLFDDT